MMDTFWKLPLFRLFKGDVKARADTNVSSDGQVDIEDAGDFYTWFTGNFSLPNERKAMYDFYEVMDASDLSGSVLDAYAEDATQMDPNKNRVIWAEGPDKKIVDAVNDMLRTMRADEEARGIIRDLAKSGDVFERLVYATTRGVLATHFVKPGKVSRNEDKEKRLRGFYQDGAIFRIPYTQEVDKKVVVKGEPLSYPWDFVHFRLRGKNREVPYGTSLLANARRPWKQIQLAEDQALAYRLRRQGTRNAWFIDTGTQDPFEESATIQAFRKRLRKAEIVDPLGGKYNHQYNPMTPLQDIVLGKKKDSATTVETLEGAQNVNDMTDVNYYINKFFSAVRAPKAYFGFEGEINQKQTLANQDVRYARGVRGLQGAFMQGMRTMAEIHLVLLNPNPDSTEYNWRIPGKDFKLHMAPVSYLAEMEMLELVQLRANVTATFLDMARDNASLKAANWVMFILRDVLRLSDAKIDDLVNKNPPPPPPEGAGGEESVTREVVNVQSNLRKVDGVLSKGEQKEIEEAIRRNPDLAKSILLARRVYEEDRTLEPERIFEYDGTAKTITYNKSKLPDKLEDCFGVEEKDEPKNKDKEKDKK